MNPAYISALSALSGSAIGALASLATTWLTQHHQDERRQRAQENVRRERVFVEFIDLSSKAFVDALQRTSIQDPSHIVPLYATMGKLRLFASDRTIEAAERVMDRIIETYYSPQLNTQKRPDVGGKSDIIREFAEQCRTELRG
jgi:poly(3-hydroxybutyrate) depolymerase